MQELLQQINAVPSRRLLYHIQHAQVRNEALAGWRARSAQVRKHAGLHTFLRRRGRQVVSSSNPVERSGQMLWLN